MVTNAFDVFDLKIEKFIFHVVHHGEDDPILMDETPLEGFEVFFKKRILEVLTGNKYFFEPNSIFLDAINKAEAGSLEFIDASKQLAISFHSHVRARVKPGVMILTRVLIQNKVHYVLIKYDHEEVITYLKDGGKAILKEVQNTFSKSKDALQKSAVFEFSNGAFEVTINDKSDIAGITKFFRDFLGVNRRYDNTELTKRVKEAYMRVVTKYKAGLPNDYTSNASSHFYTTVQAKDVFEVDDFLATIFNQYNSEAIKRDFERELKTKDILGESFEFNKNIPRPRQRKFRTEEGITIQVPNDAGNTFKIKNTDRKTVITITTSKLSEENG